jgi:hypothetical protein
MYLTRLRMSSFLMRKQKLAGLLVIIGLLSAQCQAEEHHRKLWKVSVAVLGAATIADVQSSLGRVELNPYLASSNGLFNGRSAALKGASVSAMVGVQWLMLRHNPRASKYAAGANFAASAITGAVVVHNHMLK